MKKFLFGGIALFASMAIMPNVYAYDANSIQSEADLKACLGVKDAVCTLTADITSTGYISITKDVTIDLNNRQLIMSGADSNFGYMGLYILKGSNVTIKNGTITSKDIVTRYNFPSTISLYGANLKLEKVKVSGQDKALPINLNDGTNSLTIDSQSEVSSTNMTSIANYSKTGTSTINVYGKVSESGTYSAFDGDKDAKETIINVYNGANITSDKGAGILERGNGTINVYGGNITGFSGIIAVDGKVNVTGGNIKGTGQGTPAVSPEADGSVKDNGAAIFVLPDANKSVEVDIEGGTLTSENNYALSAPGDNKNLDITISGGTFNGNSEKGAVEVNGKTSFISGGKFNSDITEYLAEGVTQDDNGNVIDPNAATDEAALDDVPKTGSELPIALVGLLGLATLAGAYSLRVAHARK